MHSLLQPPSLAVGMRATSHITPHGNVTKAFKWPSNGISGESSVEAPQASAEATGSIRWPAATSRSHKQPLPQQLAYTTCVLMCAGVSCVVQMRCARSVTRRQSTTQPLSWQLYCTR